MSCAIARAWGWRRQLEAGTASTIGDIASAEKLSDQFINHRLRLAYLALEVPENRQTWLIAVAGPVATGLLFGFAGLWGVPYLVLPQGLGRSAATGLTSMVFIGWGLGAPVISLLLSDRIRRRRLPFVLGLG